MSSFYKMIGVRRLTFWKGSTVLLFLYSMVVSFALVLVISKNFKTDVEDKK